MSDSKSLPTLLFETEHLWTTWLEKNGSESSGIWMKIAKKGSAHCSISYETALGIALCYGWIDGQKKGLDDDFWLQKFTPRTKKSIWSKINCEKAERLISEGKMKASGAAEIERAKADGRWEAAYESQSKIEVPADLQLALDANPRAAEFFKTLNSVNRYAILFRIHNVKKAETRARKIEEYVRMLEEGKKIHP